MKTDARNKKSFRLPIVYILLSLWKHYLISQIFRLYGVRMSYVFKLKTNNNMYYVL